MSVYRRILGRELPCSIFDLLQIAALPLTAEVHESLLRRCAVGEPKAADLHRLGLSHLARQEPGLARMRLAEAVLRKPHSAELRIALAAANELLADHAAAAAELEAALDCESSHSVELHCAAGLCLERAGQPGAAAEHYRTATVEQPGNLFALNRLSAIQLAAAHPVEAALTLLEILKHHPAERSARVELAHLLQLDGRPSEATWEYEQALCLEPDSWELPIEVASQIQQANGSTEAIALLQRLIQTQPHFPDLRMRLANLYSMEGEDSAAVTEYMRALALHPEYLDCHIALARHETRAGRLESAADHLRTAIVINEQNVEIYAGLALALHRSGRTSQGEEITASAGRIAQNSAVLRAQLAMLEDQLDRAAQDDLPLAGGHGDLDMNWIEQLLSLDEAELANFPARHDLRLRLGLMLRLSGKPQRAVKVLRELVRENPGCSEGWLHLGLTLAEMGHGAAGRRALAKGIRLEADAAILNYRLGLIYCGQMEFDLAMERIAQQNGEDAAELVMQAVDDLHLGLGRRSSSAGRWLAPVAK